MAASKWMSDDDITAITKIITQWPLWKPFGWEELRQEIKVQFNFPDVSKVWTRQQLPKYPSIKDAYSAKKQQIRKNKGQVTTSSEIPPAERKLKERIVSLEAENQILQAENDRLHEKFELWLYNAYVKNITEEVLNSPLPTAAPGTKKKKTEKSGDN